MGHPYPHRDSRDYGKLTDDHDQWGVEVDLVCNHCGKHFDKLALPTWALPTLSPQAIHLCPACVRKQGPPPSIRSAL